MMTKISRGRSLLALLGIAAVASARAAAGTLVLVRDGAPAATIVVAAAAGEKVKTAAQELQDYVAKLSGARLPLQTDAFDR